MWILDGLEVTIVGSIAGAISAKGSGINLSSADVAGWAASMYVAGACFGALLFGRLTDMFGRKKLLMITLGVYLSATIATAFAWTPLFFFACRFVTGMCIGGEYSAINSAIDELIPAKHRGRIDIREVTRDIERPVMESTGAQLEEPTAYARGTSRAGAAARRTRPGEARPQTQ